MAARLIVVLGGLVMFPPEARYGLSLIDPSSENL
jgi:hypothetical protein